MHGSSLSMTVVESSGDTFAALMFVFTWLLKNLKSVVGGSGSAPPPIFLTQMTELTQEKSGEGTECGRICIKFRFKRSIFPHASLLKSKRSFSLRILY